MKKIDSFLVFCLGLVFYLYYQRIHPLFGDEFIILLQAQRVIDGQVPYRDFFQFITPGSIYLSAVWLKIFGNSIVSIRLFSALEGATIALLVYLLIKRVLRSKTIILIVVLFTLCFCTTFWPLFSHHWLSTATALLALLFMGRFVESKSVIYLSLSGLFAGFTLIILQNKGGLIFLALLLFVFIDIFLLSEHYTQDILKKFRGFLRYCFLLTFFFSIPFLTLIVYLYSQDALTDFIYDTFVWVAGYYRRFNAYPNYFFMGNYSIYKICTETPFPYNLFRARDIVVSGYLPPVVIGLSIFHSIGVLKKRMEDVCSIERNYILVVIAGIFMFLSILYRSDIVHITFVFPFVLVLLGVLLDNYLGMYRKFSRFKRSTLILIISFFLFYGFYGAVARIRHASSFKYSFDTKIGRFYTNKKSVADFYDNVFKNVDERITDEYIFVYLWSPFVYFISGKKNPTGFDSVIPDYNTDEQLMFVTKELKDKRVNFIVYDGVDEIMIRDPISCSYPMADIKMDNVLNLFIKHNYEEIYEIRYDENISYKILKRREKD